MILMMDLSCGILLKEHSTLVECLTMSYTLRIFVVWHFVMWVTKHSSVICFLIFSCKASGFVLIRLVEWRKLFQ